MARCLPLAVIATLALPMAPAIAAKPVHHHTRKAQRHKRQRHRRKHHRRHHRRPEQTSALVRWPIPPGVSFDLTAPPGPLIPTQVPESPPPATTTTTMSTTFTTTTSPTTTTTSTSTDSAPPPPPPPPPPPSPPPSPSCTEHAASVSEAASLLASAGGEAVVCLAAGSYGELDLAGAHSQQVTIEPEPGSVATVAGIRLADGASGITIHNLFITGGVSIGAGDSQITVDHNDIDGAGPGGTGEGVEDRSVDCSAPHAPVYPGCETRAPAGYITISGNTIHGYGEGGSEDAIHLNHWEHVRVTANEFYDLEEHGEHTDALQSVWGGHDLAFDHNYEHDNQAQGFFIKDGDAAEVTVSENLFLRNNNEGMQENNIQIFDTTGVAITGNTVWDNQGDLLRTDGAATAPTASADHNVEQVLNTQSEGGAGYSLNEDYDVFEEAPWTFEMGAHSVVVKAPEFRDPASDDYRLKSNPEDIGVDWAPSEYVYGPTGN